MMAMSSRAHLAETREIWSSARRCATSPHHHRNL